MEAMLVDLLSKFGFVEVVLTGLPHSAQVEIFANAKVIVGTSGAGITNHIFAPEGAHVIEFHPKDYSNRAHFFTTNLLDQTYQFIMCPRDQDGNLCVPREHLLRCIERVL